MIRWYLRQLETRPIFTKCFSSALIGAAGDFTQQTIEKRTKFLSINKSSSNGEKISPPFIFPLLEYDFPRLARMFSFGGFVVGPVFHVWFGALNRYIAPGSSTLPAVLSRLAADQLLMAPIFTGIFFTYQGLMERRSREEIFDRILTLTGPTLVMNYKVWPAAQLINFYLVPLQLRVLFLNGVGFWWNTFLSNMNNNEQTTKLEEIKE